MGHLCGLQPSVVGRRLSCRDVRSLRRPGRFLALAFGVGSVVVGSVGGIASPVASGAASKAVTTSTKLAKGKKITPRVIEVEMLATAYSPKVVRVKSKETVTFRFMNKGVAAHEALVGDLDSQLDHAKEMKAGGEHAAHEMPKSPGYILVKAKSSKTLTYTFGKPGRTLIGCHQPGHWESGMKLQVVISP